MKVQTITTSILAVALLFVGVVFLVKPMYQADGASFTGTAATLSIATTSALTANTNKVILSARADNACASRVVTVPGSMTGGLNLIFADQTDGDISSTTLSATAGHFQAASTTQVYDSGLYGCGMMVARSWTSGTIMVSEF